MYQKGQRESKGQCCSWYTYRYGTNILYLLYYRSAFPDFVVIPTLCLAFHSFFSRKEHRISAYLCEYVGNG